MRDNMLIGITGGIGSGKTLAARYLAGLGENVICADDAARRVVLPGEKGSELIRDEFGKEYLLQNGELDRKKLAELVFSDKEKLLKLNALLHPLILESIYREAKKLSGRVFIEAPLLIKAGMHEKMDYVWLVTADLGSRIKRVAQRDKADEAHIKRRIESQMNDEEMARFADEIIENNGGKQELYEKIDALLKKPEYSR